MVRSQSLRWSSVLFWALCGCATTTPTATTASTTTAQTGTAGTAGTSSATPTTAATAATTPAEAALPPMPTGLQGPPRPWAQLSHEERGHYMAESVVPAMRSLLQAFDAQHFARVTCATCHGANAREVNFHMPNSLPALPRPGSEAWTALSRDHSRIFEFMEHRVLPAQAQLMGMQPYNPQTHTGFGCFNCHPHAGS